MAVDQEGHAVFFDLRSRTVQHRMNFDAVHGLAFSPDNRWLAVLLDRIVQVWRIPPKPERALACQLELFKTFGGHGDAILSADWSEDSTFLLTASADMTARLYKICQETDSSQWTPISLAGHRHLLLGAYFVGGSAILTVGRDGMTCRWSFDGRAVEGPLQREQLKLQSSEDDPVDDEQQQRLKISSLAFDHSSGMLCAGFQSGAFGLFQIGPKTVDLIYCLSLGTSQFIDATAISKGGEWLAFGSGSHGQLLVWEWRSESYILRQQGHTTSLTCLDLSRDGQTLATGSVDGRVRVWSVAKGFCHATFTEHSATVTAVAFSPNGRVLLSASADGTVHAYDLIRQKPFRVMSSPSGQPLAILAVDPTGDLIAGGGSGGGFEIYLWSLQTGRLVEVLRGGHTAPISGLAFDPVGRLLASSSWDKTVRLWDVYGRWLSSQSLQHAHEVVGLTWRHDGGELATATLGREILRWDPEMAQLVGQIECQRDICSRPLDPASLTCLAYSVDGRGIWAGGSFSWIGAWALGASGGSTAVLVSRFPLSPYTDATVSRDKARIQGGSLLDDHHQTSSLRQTSAFRMAATGRAWAALTGEGILVYTLDDRLQFDPFDLDCNLTPAAVTEALASGAFLKALVLALRLNLPGPLIEAWRLIPADLVAMVTRQLPPKHLPALLRFLASLLDQSPQPLPLLLTWVTALLTAHALELKNGGRTGDGALVTASLRLLYRATHTLYGGLGKMANENTILLRSLGAASATDH